MTNGPYAIFTSVRDPERIEEKEQSIIKKGENKMKDLFRILLYCLPLLLIIGYLIFYVMIFLEYKDVPVSDIPAWVYLVLYNNSRG